MLGRLINNYEILSVVGEGGMGTVYLARHPIIERQAAIKILRPELAKDSSLVKRFINEARAATAIRHPHIIDMMDVGILPDGTPYLMMEYLEGGSLATRLENGVRLPPAHAIEIACQTADAVGAAHEKGIVHRDLKPDNLFLIRDAKEPDAIHVKVLDFGIAKLKGDTLADTPRTRTGAILGTPLYMSPEQCRGSTECIDLRSDIYSLGVILFQMLCGTTPFTSEGTGELLGMHIFVEPPTPRSLGVELPSDLEATLLRCLAKEPAARFPNMPALIATLRAISLDPMATCPVSRPATLLDPPQTTLSVAAVPSIAKSEAAGPVAVSSSRSARRWVVPGLALFASAALGSALLSWTREPPVSSLSASSLPTPAPSSQAVPAPVAPPPAPITQVSLTLNSKPEGASVLRVEDRKRLGTTPYQGTFPRSEQILEILVEKPGYRSQARRVSLGQDQEVTMVLAPKTGRRPPARPDSDEMRKL